jgi:hypothetical protein
VPVPQTLKSGSRKRRSNPEEVRVNKRDSPRISEDIHIDRKQPLGVSLKGSPKQVLANCGLDEKSGMEHRQERRMPQDKKV